MKLQIDNLGKVAITVEKDYWNINKCYDKLVAVEREGYGAYLSRKPVPEGIYIDNREYWIRLSFPGSGGNINLVQTLGYDAGVAISQKAITEKFDEIEAILNDIISGGIITTVTFNPPSVSVNESTEIIIGVEVNIEADKISIFRGNVKIGEDGSGTVYSVSDTITPSSDLPIIYRVKVEKNGKIVSNVTATLPIDKADGLVKWMRGGNEVTEDTVTALETGHTYPTLYNPDELTPISYTSSNPSVARVTKLNDYSYKIDILSFGSTDIHAIFSGNVIYNAIDLAYNLVVSKANYEDFKWVDPQTGNSIMDDPTWEINKADLPNVIYPILKRTGDRGTVTYSTSPEQSNIASINSVTGNITLGTALGTVVINAQFSGDNIYNAKTVSYSLKVQEQQAEVYWEISLNGEDYVRGNSFEYKVLDYPRPSARLVYPSTTSVEFKLYPKNGTTQIPAGQWPYGLTVTKTTDVQTGSTTALVKFPTRLTSQGTTEQYDLRASLGSSDVATLTFSYTASDRNFVWNPSAPSPVYMGALVDNVYKIPASQLPVISATGYTNQVDGFRLSSDSSAYASRVRVTAINVSAYTYKVEVIGEVTEAQGITVGIEAYANSSTQFRAKTQTYQLTILPPATPDYYVGYADSPTAFPSKTGEELAAGIVGNAEQKHIGDADYQHTFAGSELIFYCLFKEGNAPHAILNPDAELEDTITSATFEAGGNITHTPVTIHDTASDTDIVYKVFAMGNPVITGTVIKVIFNKSNN